jgi:hypothetical protein
MSVTAKDVLKKMGNPDTTFDRSDWVRLAFTSAIIVFAAIDIGIVDHGKMGMSKTDNEKLLWRLNNATQFSYHAYDSNNHGPVHGPFLGKVRLSADGMHVQNNSGLTPIMRQSSCDTAEGIVQRNSTTGIYTPINAILMDKCKMMRTPDLYFGKVHSSWSVLGAQSIYNLVKHICFILIAFLVFSWIEDQILKQTPDNLVEVKLNEKFNYFRSHFRFMRSLTVIITIVLFSINIGMDITGNMHEVDSNHENNVAIGSITTGVAFCLVSILIICLSHLDEPYSEEVAATPEIVNGGDKTGVNDAAMAEDGGGGFVDPNTVNHVLDPTSNSRLGPQQYHFGRAQFGGPLQANFQWFNEEVAWSKDMKIRPLKDTSESYRKFQEIYRNIHVSYLMLLLFPMVSLLALVRTERKIVDVHVQLIFFSTIFFAVLDIIQSRVASVLASFQQENSVSMTNAIGTIKGFVVLAFILAKLFVFVPAYQLTVRYYTKTDDLAFWLVVPQLVAFIFFSFFDLAYITGFKFFTTDENRKDVQSRMVNLRQFLFWVYLGFLCWMLFWI